jgi:predicted GIY-YIG superfamily endonuclease
MAFSEWWNFANANVEGDKNAAGVYQLGNSSGIVYIGSSNDLKRRLKEHLAESASTCIRKNATHYRIEYRSDYQEAEQAYYDAFVRQYGRKPQCNDIRP